MSIDEVMDAAFSFATACVVFTERSGGFTPAGRSVVDERAMQLRAAITQHVAEAVKAEREECAKVCDSVCSILANDYGVGFNQSAIDCAREIRARADSEVTT